MRAAKYGQWLDVYLTLLQPLPMPVGGLLGATYKPPAADGAAAASSGELPFTAFVLLETEVTLDSAPTKSKNPSIH